MIAITDQALNLIVTSNSLSQVIQLINYINRISDLKPL